MSYVVTAASGHLGRLVVAALLDRHARGAEDNSQGIWRLMIYELWHREFVDGGNGEWIETAGRELLSPTAGA